jgi:prepilin-type N-terminal cleavage/methylation domain-containing protein
MTRRGFTILELLVVISIMAIIATLATGAALKAIRQSRNKRIDTTCKALEIALSNYRAKENAWPFTPSDLVKDPEDANKRWAHGKNNKEVFKKLYHGDGGSRTIYLDGSAVMAEYRGKRALLGALLESGLRDASLAFPDPQESSQFRYYCVEFNVATDSVKVHRQDYKHWPNRGEPSCWCPELKR